MAVSMMKNIKAKMIAVSITTSESWRNCFFEGHETNFISSLTLRKKFKGLSSLIDSYFVSLCIVY